MSHVLRTLIKYLSGIEKVFIRCIRVKGLLISCKSGIKSNIFAWIRDLDLIACYLLLTFFAI